MRTSKDIYKLPNGILIAVSQNEQPPKLATLWSGFNYKGQYWVFKGKRDRRTLKQLQKSL